MNLVKRLKNNNGGSLFDNNSLKVIVIGCMAIITALLVMSITSILIMNKAVVQKLKTNDLGNLAESIGAVIEGKIDRAVDASLMLANDPIVKSWIENEEKDESEGRLVQYKMEDLVNSFGYDTSFLVSDVTKHYWSFHSDTFELLDTVSIDDPDDRWFFTSIKMGKRYEINIDPNKELGDTFVWINTLMGDVESPIAVTGIGMNLSNVIDELVRDETKSKVENDIWLVDGQGIIYLAKNPKYLEQNIQDYLPPSLLDNIGRPENMGKEFEIAEYSLKGVKYDIAYKTIKDTKWKLMVQIPRSESMSFLRAVTIYTIISCLIIIILMVTTFYYLSNRIANPYKRALQLNQELEKTVGERTRDLQERNAKIQDSIDYAKMIQQTILPSDSELKKRLKGHFVIFEQRDTVGGDFYWMKSYSDGFLLVVGDCTGHGVPGALMTTAVNAILNRIADELWHDNPAVILKELDRLIKQSFRKDGSRQIISNGLDAGVLYVSNSGRGLFSGANISALISDGDKIREIKGSSDTIDCLSRRKEKRFENHIIEYNENNTFYMATDGFKDQPGGEVKLPFGKSRMLALLEVVKKLEMEEQKALLLSTLKEYEGNETRRDDITMLGFKL